MCVLPEDEWLLEHYVDVYENDRLILARLGSTLPSTYRQLTPYQATQYQAGQSIVSDGELLFQVLPTEPEKARIDPYFALCPVEMRDLGDDGTIQDFEPDVVASWLHIQEQTASISSATDLEGYFSTDMVDYLQHLGVQESEKLVSRTVISGTECDLRAQAQDQKAFIQWTGQSQEN